MAERDPLTIIDQYTRPREADFYHSKTQTLLSRPLCPPAASPHNNTITVYYNAFQYYYHLFHQHNTQPAATCLNNPLLELQRLCLVTTVTTAVTVVISSIATTAGRRSTTPSESDEFIQGLTVRMSKHVVWKK
jgi:hypothetical protein